MFIRPNSQLIAINSCLPVALTAKHKHNSLIFSSLEHAFGNVYYGLVQITRIEIFKVEIPMTAHVELPHYKLTHKPAIIVKVITKDGVVGYGEAAAFAFPFYTYETVDTCFIAIRDYLAPRILGKHFALIEDFVDTLSCVRGHNIAKTAVETAAWMVQSTLRDKSLSKIIGGTRKRIAVGESIDIKPSLTELLRVVGKSLEQGFQRIKIKIRPGWDIVPVKAIRYTFGDIALTVDGNSVYSLSHIDIFKELDTYNLLMIEQPLANDDILDHAILQRSLQTPICLDESIESFEDARKAIKAGACRVINIKPGRVGGLLASKRIHDLGAENGVGVWCGGMFETGIGRAFNLASASLAGYNYPADMSPASDFYEADLVEPSFSIDRAGFIKVPSKPGLGFKVHESNLRKYTKQYEVLSI